MNKPWFFASAFLLVVGFTQGNPVIEPAGAGHIEIRFKNEGHGAVDLERRIFGTEFPWGLGVVYRTGDDTFTNRSESFQFDALQSDFAPKWGAVFLALPSNETHAKRIELDAILARTYGIIYQDEKRRRDFLSLARSGKLELKVVLQIDASGRSVESGWLRVSPSIPWLQDASL